MPLQQQPAASVLPRFLGCAAITAGVKQASMYSFDCSGKVKEVVALLTNWSEHSKSITQVIMDDEDFDPLSFATKATGVSEKYSEIQRSIANVYVIRAQMSVASYIENRHPTVEGAPSPYQTIDDLKSVFHSLAPIYI